MEDLDMPIVFYMYITTLQKYVIILESEVRLVHV